jgi:hypothetical protein
MFFHAPMAALAQRDTCPDCGVDREQTHRLACPLEQCPVCHHQLVTCEHRADILLD